MQIKTYIVRNPNIITFLEYVLHFTSSVAIVSIIHKLTKIIMNVNIQATAHLLLLT